MDFVRSKIKEYEQDEYPVSVIVQVGNCPLHCVDALSDAMRNIEEDYKDRSTVCLQFYTQDGVYFINRNGHLDRVKGLILKQFFNNFNREHGTDVKFFPFSPLNYFEY